MYHEDLRLAHWVIVLLVFFQFLTGPGMAAAFERGLSAATPGAGTAIVHGLFGIGILAAMTWRLSLRRRTSVPPPPETEPELVQRISRGTHYAFYVFLIAMPFAGLLAVLSASEWIGGLHALAAKLLWLLVLSHIAGAALHMIARDGVVTRMTGLEPEPDA